MGILSGLLRRLLVRKRNNFNNKEGKECTKMACKGKKRK